jgi:DNA repair photolyase
VSEPNQLRWRLAEEDGHGQQALFEEDAPRWRAGHGEFRGLEFLHVNAKRIINEVPAASRMPFRFTINAYRGCSHSCTYCMSGDTPILMADGCSKLLADVQVGDAAYGTVRQGVSRQLLVTPVLDHWQTVKTAYRVTLEDGTELVTSGDHRLLSNRGWKHVTSLALSDRLIGVRVLDAAALNPRGAGQTRQRRAGLLLELAKSVEFIEPLGLEMPMYDITTGTGDFIANGIVSHNCFARPTHEYLGLDAGRDFETRIVVKINAVERARAEVAARNWGGHTIAMGTNTDPYQRCEGKYRLTRGIVEVLSEARNPFSILTKSTLILRDLDLLSEAARRTDVRAALSIGTLDEEVWRSSEPGTPHPRQRLEAVARLNEAGVPTGVLVAPILPGLSDAPEQLEAVRKGALEAGAVSVTPIVLHLRPGVREQYMAWLGDRHPDLVATYGQLYRRAYAPKNFQNEVVERFWSAGGTEA